MMTEIDRMVAAKQELRRKLAALPIEQKLDILDQLHERAEDIQRAVRSRPGQSNRQH